MEKLSKPMQEELLFDLINAFSLVKSVEDSALFIQDLLTETEVKRLSKRLGIARLLMKGEKYEDIMIELRTSRATIAKIGSWLSERGEGFKKVVRKLPEPEKIKEWWEKADWEKLVEKYPRYFWPLTLDEGSKKFRVQQQKERLSRVLEGLGRKETVRRKIQEEADEYYKEKWEEKKRAAFRKRYPTSEDSKKDDGNYEDEKV